MITINLTAGESIEVLGDRLVITIQSSNRIVVESSLLSPQPGDLVFSSDFDNNLEGWTLQNNYFEVGNSTDHADVPLPDDWPNTSLRAKLMSERPSGGNFPISGYDICSRILQLDPGSYLFEYWQVQHDSGEYEIGIQDGMSHVPLYIGGTEAQGAGWEQFIHPFEVVDGQTIQLRFEYLAPPRETDPSGVKVTHVRIWKAS